MSHSKYRPDAEAAKQQASQEAHANDEPARGDDWQWEHAIEDPENFMKEFKQVLTHTACQDDHPGRRLTAADGRRILEGGLLFLEGLVRSTQVIMRSVPIEGLRRVCAGDIPCVGGAHFPEAPTREDAKKRPRASTHPLMRLISLAVQADRLMLRTCQVLWPELFVRPAVKGEVEDYANAYDRQYKNAYG